MQHSRPGLDVWLHVASPNHSQTWGEARGGCCRQCRGRYLPLLTRSSPCAVMGHAVLHCAAMCPTDPSGHAGGPGAGKGGGKGVDDEVNTDILAKVLRCAAMRCAVLSCGVPRCCAALRGMWFAGGVLRAMPEEAPVLCWLRGSRLHRCAVHHAM